MLPKNILENGYHIFYSTEYSKIEFTLLSKHSLTHPWKEAEQSKLVSPVDSCLHTCLDSNDEMV